MKRLSVFFVAFGVFFLTNCKNECVGGDFYYSIHGCNLNLIEDEQDIECGTYFYADVKHLQSFDEISYKRLALNLEYLIKREDDGCPDPDRVFLIGDTPHITITSDEAYNRAFPAGTDLSPILMNPNAIDFDECLYLQNYFETVALCPWGDNCFFTEAPDSIRLHTFTLSLVQRDTTYSAKSVAVYITL